MYTTEAKSCIQRVHEYLGQWLFTKDFGHFTQSYYTQGDEPTVCAKNKATSTNCKHQNAHCSTRRRYDCVLIRLETDNYLTGSHRLTARTRRPCHVFPAAAAETA